jgi:hypothetical protein
VLSENMTPHIRSGGRVRKDQSQGCSIYSAYIMTCSYERPGESKNNEFLTLGITSSAPHFGGRHGLALPSLIGTAVSMDDLGSSEEKLGEEGKKEDETHIKCQIETKESIKGQEKSEKKSKRI